MAAFAFFFSLGYAAKSLSGVLNRPEAWRVIDRVIAVLMFVIAGAILGPHV